uniref:Voltage-dependent calcium channel gamma-1 subunit n=1 Tax=Oryzias melastigma TaxID=30732 RepID=A0A3B3BQY4_ORYME
SPAKDEGALPRRNGSPGGFLHWQQAEDQRPRVLPTSLLQIQTSWCFTYPENCRNSGQISSMLSFSVEYNISAAAISIFSLAFMILGSLCLLGWGTGKGKGRDYLLKPAGMFFAFAGLCAFISLEVMRQSVKRMIESEDTIWIEYYYSWSFACACAGFVLLFLCGISLLVLSMPQMPRNPWETCMDAEPEQAE